MEEKYLQYMTEQYDRTACLQLGFLKIYCTISRNRSCTVRYEIASHMECVSDSLSNPILSIGEKNQKKTQTIQRSNEMPSFIRLAKYLLIPL